MTRVTALLLLVAAGSTIAQDPRTFANTRFDIPANLPAEDPEIAAQQEGAPKTVPAAPQAPQPPPPQQPPPPPAPQPPPPPPPPQQPIQPIPPQPLAPIGGPPVLAPRQPPPHPPPHIRVFPPQPRSLHPQPHHQLRPLPARFEPVQPPHIATHPGHTLGTLPTLPPHTFPTFPTHAPMTFPTHPPPVFPTHPPLPGFGAPQQPQAGFGGFQPLGPQPQGIQQLGLSPQPLPTPPTLSQPPPTPALLQPQPPGNPVPREAGQQPQVAPNPPGGNSAFEQSMFPLNGFFEPLPNRLPPVPPIIPLPPHFPPEQQQQFIAAGQEHNQRYGLSGGFPAASQPEVSAPQQSIDGPAQAPPPPPPPPAFASIGTRKERDQPPAPQQISGGMLSGQAGTEQVQVAPAKMRHRVKSQDLSPLREKQFESEISIDAADPRPSNSLWFVERFDTTECRSNLGKVEQLFRKKFPASLARTGKGSEQDAQLASIVAERLFECDRKARAGHWEKVDQLIGKIQLSKSEETECRSGLIQERISCMNLLSYTCQFVEPSFQFKLVPARITVEEARQAENGADKCRKVVKLVKKRLEG